MIQNLFQATAGEESVLHLGCGAWLKIATARHLCKFEDERLPQPAAIHHYIHGEWSCPFFDCKFRCHWLSPAVPARQHYRRQPAVIRRLCARRLRPKAVGMSESERLLYF